MNLWTVEHFFLTFWLVLRAKEGMSMVFITAQGLFWEFYKLLYKYVLVLVCTYFQSVPYMYPIILQALFRSNIP